MGRWMRMIGMLCLMLTLPGCVNQLDQRPGMIVEEEPITLRIAWWGGEFRNNATIAVIDLYEKLNPHVNIEYEYSSFNEYWRKLAPHAAGNALPDIIQMDISYLSQYSSLQLLEDMTPYMQSGLIDTTDIEKEQLESGSLNGKTYGLSLGVNAMLSIYDPEVLKANDIELPTDTWTWADFDRMGEQLLGKGIYLGTYFTPEQFFAYYLRQYGSKLYAEDGKRLGYEDDGLFIEYFGRMQQLAEKKLIFAPDIWTSDIGQPDNDPFYLGEALFSWGYSNQFISTAQRYGKPLTISPMPGPNSQDGLFLKPGMFFSMAGNSRHKEEAAKFISFFVNDLDANLLLKGERGVPVSSSVKERMKLVVEPELAQVFDYIDWVADNSTQMDPPDPVGAPEVTAVLRELYDLLLFGKITPEQAAVEFRERANAILGGKL
ncbi:sugar ABC transporter substrate-binding protein [Paenibacillus xylanexedens]|uniref:ABC transporter substrate-binding protein n=1 Tax=Paenibacillus xylanexedens TaxID=528191 RepID=UPI0009381425|nr:ABC transporter substrate-binding protein [Paenibacillus xylanexedens]APO42723.1 sugar ABC transporter substrate-binding protein [Paenibacillus xylanexedens]